MSVLRWTTDAVLYRPRAHSRAGPDVEQLGLDPRARCAVLARRSRTMSAGGQRRGLQRLQRATLALQARERSRDIGHGCDCATTCSPIP